MAHHNEVLTNPALGSYSLAELTNELIRATGKPMKEVTKMTKDGVVFGDTKLIFLPVSDLRRFWIMLA